MAPAILGIMPPLMVPSATNSSMRRGVLDKQGELLTELTPRRIDELVADGTISGGMIPKIAGAIDAAKSGVNAVHIIDGRVPHAMLLEVLTDQAYGTMISSR
jgi:acetylglutamate kinase